MQIGIPREIAPGERRVAATPDTTKRLVDLGYSVAVEHDAGAAASYPDSLYERAGATIVDDTKALWEGSDIVFKVRPPAEHPELGDEVALLREGALLITFIYPAQNKGLLDRLVARKVTALAMDAVPRISRAQSMDALSSMANIAGYRAVVEAANAFGSFFTGQITAAGRVQPAKVLVIGAGVAGLAAIGAARGLGAIVRAFDTRAAVKEQVESLGAEFLEVEFEESGEGEGGYAKVMSKAFLDAEMAMFREQAQEIDIVITTALIPGKPAPKLWKTEAVELMKPGSVVVDLAAEQGGNCELTVPGEAVVDRGVHIIGYSDMTSRLATTASQLYGTNLVHLTKLLGDAKTLGGEDGKQLNLDLDDEIVRGALVTHKGEITWPPPKVEPKEIKKPALAKMQSAADARPAPEPAAKPAASKKPAGKKPAHGHGHGAASAQPSEWGWLVGLIGLALAGAWAYLRFTTPATATVSPALVAFLQHMTVFVLACFVGWQVIWNVTAALHTPLMSVTNAISGIIILGGILHGRHHGGVLEAHGGVDVPLILAAVAILVAMINVAGGFLVTQRMLKMFRKDDGS
ncbi:MAG: Re/Si-specific NAD(P)(+) transhydrogenase subunit alpha [Myxococcales bacterium]|nr:Re/Si-specific NAD(P)(+) transhydrogenase subunit alpha [Myxococcales bacterium]